MQTEQVAELIQSILASKSTEELKSYEKRLNDFKDNKVDSYLQSLMQIISTGQLGNDIRIFALTQLRNSLSAFSTPSMQINLSSISQETVQVIQSGMFERITIEENNKIRKHLGEAMGEIGYAFLYRNLWSNLVQNMWKLFEHQNVEVQLTAFSAIRILIKYSHKSFTNNLSEISILIRNGLAHHNGQMKVEAILTTGQLLEEFEKQECAGFTNLVLPLLESIYSVLTSAKSNSDSSQVSEDDLINVVEVILTILESESSFFASRETEFYNAMIQMISVAPSRQVKRILIEGLVSFFENDNEAASDIPNKEENLLLLILFEMVQIDDEISDEWLNSEKGYRDGNTQSDERSDSIVFGQNMLNIFIPCFENGLELTLKNVRKLFEEGELKKDWRFPYAAMMGLSQIGEFVDDILELEPLLKLSYEYSFEHVNPLIRYAFCQVVGQISDDMAPLFQEQYGSDLLPKMMQMLSDTVPIVRSHAAASLVNFVETMTPDMVNSHIETCLNLLLSMAETGTKIERISAVPAISSLVESAKGYFEQYLNTAMSRLFKILSEASMNINLQELCGNTLECISIISHVQRKSAFVPFLEQFISSLGSSAQLALEHTDYDATFIFDAWNRLAHKYAGEMNQALLIHSAPLFKLVSRVIKTCSSEDEDDDHESRNGIQNKQEESSQDPSEVQSSLKMLSTFAKSLSIYVYNFAELIFESIARLCASKHEGIREEACRCLPLVVGSVAHDTERVKNILKEVIKTLRDATECEFEANMMRIQIGCMDACIQVGRTEFLSDMEFKFLCNQLMNLLRDSDSRKLKLKKELQSSTDPSEKKILPMEYQAEEQLHLQIARIFGSIYKTHTEQALSFSASIYTDIIPKTLEDSTQYRLVQFGMILLQDIVTHIGFIRFEQKWNEIINIFLWQLNHSSRIVKREALIGIARIVVSTPSIYIYPYLQRLREIAVEGINGAVDSKSIPNIPSNKANAVIKQQRSDAALKEHYVDIIGKLIKLHGSHFPDEIALMELWNSCLPIKIDKQIAEDQHQIYLQYLVIQINHISCESEASLLNKFALIAEFYDPNVCTAFMKPILNSFIREFMENQQIAIAYQNIFQKLSTSHQRRLTNALASIQNSV